VADIFLDPRELFFSDEFAAAANHRSSKPNQMK
jgi:hypothetical protein